MGVERLIGGKKPNVAAEQARLKQEQDAAAQEERAKAAAEQANRENLSGAMRQEASQRAAFTSAVVQDDEELRKRYLKKA